MNIRLNYQEIFCNLAVSTCVAAILYVVQFTRNWSQIQHYSCYDLSLEAMNQSTQASGDVCAGEGCEPRKPRPLPLLLSGCLGLLCLVCSVSVYLRSVNDVNLGYCQKLPFRKKAASTIGKRRFRRFVRHVDVGRGVNGSCWNALSCFPFLF